MPYPPLIDDALMFPAPPVVAIVAACPHGVNTCALTALSLDGHPSAPTHFDAPAGAPLDSAAGGRYVLAPLAEQFPICWTLDGHENVRRLRLELYRHGDAVAFWSKTLDYGEGAPAAEGSTNFNGDLHDNVHLASLPVSQVAVGAPGGGDFPMQVLTAEHAPYKLVMRIQEVQPNTRVTCAARWIYLDVIVHGITLTLENDGWIPPAGAAAAYADVRYRRLTVDTVNAVAAQLQGRDLGVDAQANVNVPLEMNVFSRTSNDFYSNALFTAKKLRFRDGPTLPLSATVRLRLSNGAAAAVQACASALGNLRLLWDWESGVRPVHPNPTAQAFIADALAYKTTEWPGARSNCHIDHGGKRGVGGGGPHPHFMALHPGTLVAPADAIAGINNRPWATSSGLVADSANVNGGKAGVLFLPSRIAGDTYRLRVYLGYPALAAFDVATDDDLLTAAGNSVCVRSAATLTVRHRIDVIRQWRKNAQADDALLDWRQVQAYLSAACIDLRPPAGTQNIVALDYQNAVNAGLANLGPALEIALGPAINQPNGEHGINFVDYAAFRAGVGVHAIALAGALAGQVFATDNAFRLAQIHHLNLQRPNGYYGTDLIFPTRADLPGTADQRRDVLLAGLGITSEQTYKDKCREWGGTIIAELCSQHARARSQDMAGIHFYHFDFADQWHQQNMVAEAVTTITNFAVCPGCGVATATVIEDQDHRVCNNIVNNNVCGCRLDESAMVVSYAPFRYMNGVLDPWAKANLNFKERAKIRAGGLCRTSAALVIAHEIGHQLGMPHAKSTTLNPSAGGISPLQHDAGDSACIMSYNFTNALNLHFCGICSLRLAGWSLGRSDINDLDNLLHDQWTVALSNHSAFNKALAPAPAAAWVTPDPVGCMTCNRPFGGLTRAHHCRLCGNVFCADHSNHTRPVRNPLKANQVSEEKVCAGCHFQGGVIAPVPGARWVPDEMKNQCAHQGCNVVFSSANRKHHCRSCGKIYCSVHVQHRQQVRNALTAEGPVSLQRVCDGCDARYG
ncbi:FYVE zinc finger domain-containing protein [Pseudomonas gingeri]|uniref:FYVE zinc finger domain-containing protein n=1 Tax=Pseudomonas gingeri TaxID=117681 RepID=UPI0015A182A2|nr:FYVE zinc finger domain-containing protein [Pseudomonas gingeri]NVZ24659.1 FYVE zinc finger domain-containing protein [Pseudomonas gingeri]